MKIKYKCDYCWHGYFDTAEECIKHESEQCDGNPKVKSCETCKNSLQDRPNGGKVYYSCKTGHKETSPVSWKQHCEFWEYDEGYAH